MYAYMISVCIYIYVYVANKPCGKAQAFLEVERTVAGQPGLAWSEAQGFKVLGC